MELGSPLLSVCFIMICLLGATRNSNGGKINCSCTDIPLRNLTELPPKTCYNITHIFRYKCLDGYVRKAGTSDLIKCKQINSAAPQWTEPSLQCIPDPKRTVIQLPRVTVTKGHTDIPHDSTITTAVTASTSLQMTQHINISASVTAESHSTEPTSSVLWVPSDHSHDFVRRTGATDGTTSTSTTAEPSNNSTANLRVFELNSTTIPVIICASLVIICAFSGISFLFYRRRSTNRVVQEPEELMPMNHVQPKQL
uniref:interleukin-15 receptor subunit alpha isoform X2 n=1 Tax=Scatophagus argus TaxID=75038 RepID=UPI001ED83C1B|nr:interleukin-15 receptor subunit alpha isoform X2 [Scatophagus argus]